MIVLPRLQTIPFLLCRVADLWYPVAAADRAPAIPFEASDPSTTQLLQPWRDSLLVAHSYRLSVGFFSQLPRLSLCIPTFPPSFSPSPPWCRRFALSLPPASFLALLLRSPARSPAAVLPVRLVDWVHEADIIDPLRGVNPGSAPTQPAAPAPSPLCGHPIIPTSTRRLPTPPRRRRSRTLRQPSPSPLRAAPSLRKRNTHRVVGLPPPPTCSSTSTTSTTLPNAWGTHQVDDRFETGAALRLCGYSKAPSRYHKPDTRTPSSPLTSPPQSCFRSL